MGHIELSSNVDMMPLAAAGIDCRMLTATTGRMTMIGPAISAMSHAAWPLIVLADGRSVLPLFALI